MSDREARRRARIEAERARRRSSRARSSSRRLVTVGAVGAAAVVGGAAFLATRGDDEPPAIGRAGSVAVADADDVAITRTPASATVTYRVETAGDSISVLTDVLSSRRPFESRLETRRGAPPGDEAFSARVGWFAHTATTGGAQPSVLEVAPAPPPTDLRLEVVLPVAEERDLVERREVRRIVGRLCQVFRSRQTLAAPIQPPATDDFVDTCVDEAGLVLEEVVTANGSVLTRRVAVDVEEDVDLDDDLFRVDADPLPAGSGGGFVRRVKEGSTPPGEFFVVDAPPAGFDYLGRFSVVPAQPENFGEDPLREGHRRAAVVDAWRRGHDIVAVEQGGTLRGVDAFEDTENAPRLTVGSLGEGELLLSGAGVEVRVLRSGGRYFRLYGTVHPDELLAVASSLRQVPGGTLELEDAPVGDQP